MNKSLVNKRKISNEHDSLEQLQIQKKNYFLSGTNDKYLFLRGLKFEKDLGCNYEIIEDAVVP